MSTITGTVHAVNRRTSTRRDIRRVRYAALAILCAGGIATARAPSSAAAKPAAAQDRAATDAAIYEQFARNAATYVVREYGDDMPLEYRPEALLNWSNPVRLQERGSIFVWLDRGRPQAIGSVFTYELAGKPREKHEFHSLADGRLTATLANEVVWAPQANAIAWQNLDAEPLSSNERQRLTEMRSIARRFRVTLADPDGNRSELRLMPQPLLRYASREHQVLDAAIFSFAVATDPEALLLVEAAGPQGNERWRFAFARFHYWALSAELDRRVVWSVALDATQATHQIGDPAHLDKHYVSFHPRSPAADR